MAAYRRVYDVSHLQADCQEPGSAPEPSVIEYGAAGYLYLFIYGIYLSNVFTGNNTRLNATCTGRPTCYLLLLIMLLLLIF